MPAFLPTISPLAHVVMSPMPIPRGIHTAFWGFSPSFAYVLRPPPRTAPTAAVGKPRVGRASLIVEREKERPKRSVRKRAAATFGESERGSGKSGLMRRHMVVMMQILRIPPPNPNGSLSRPTERQAALSFAAQRSKGPPPLTPSLPPPV